MNSISKGYKGVNDKKRFFEIIIARLYAKLSLIIPVKPSEILDLKIYNIEESSTKTITHNCIDIKLLNNLKNEIIETIDYAKREYNRYYSENEKIFYFLYGVLDKPPSPSIVSDSFIKAYIKLGISGISKQRYGGKRGKYMYPPETYKIKTIISMLININIGIVNSEYYKYI